MDKNGFIDASAIRGFAREHFAHHGESESLFLAEEDGIFGFELKGSKAKLVAVPMPPPNPDPVAEENEQDPPAPPVAAEEVPTDSNPASRKKKGQG